MLGLVLGCLLGPLPGRAAAPPRLEASPAQLLSGRDTQARLTVTGLPEDARLACSAGQVLPPTRPTPDTLEAVLLPPRGDTLAPVLCAAVSPSTGALAVGVLAVRRQQVLPLTGLPPLSRVEVRIGEQLHGPVRADTTGQAEVPVLLTPGEPQALLRITALGQPTEERPLPLPVSQRPVVLLVAGAGAVEADGLQGVRVWAFGVDARGEPLRAPLVFTHAPGGWEPQRVAPGIHVGTFLPAPRASPGEGVLTASAEGAQASLRLELRAGIHPQVRLEAALREVLADGDSGTDITVRLHDEHGRPLPAQPVRLQAALGQLSPPQDLGDGTYRARYRAPVGGGGGEERLSALLEGAAPATLVLTLRAPPRLHWDEPARELPANGLARVVLHLSARDARGLPAPDGTELTLSTTLGSLPGSVRTQGGRAQVEYVSGTRAGEALVQARWDEASVQTRVRLVPGPPARLRVRAEAREVRCDGEDSARVHLLVEDGQGNPLDGLPITLSAAGSQAERGAFERVAALGAGEFVTRFHAPGQCEGGTATLLAAVGEARGAASLTLASRTPRGLTVRVGAQGNLGARAQPALELEGDVRPYALGERLAATGSLQVALGHFARSGETTSHEPFSLEARSLTTTLSAGARFTHPLTRALSAYVGAGLDAHLVHLDWRLSLEPLEQRQVLPALGGHLRVGLLWALGPTGALVAQGRYGLARLPSDGPFQGPVGGASASLGYRFEL